LSARSPTANTAWLRIGPGCVTLQIRARPGAGRQQFVRIEDHGLVVALNSPPDKGKANNELLDLLARSFGLPRSALEIVRGSNARLKLVQITTATPDKIAVRVRDLAERIELK
jgi:uncharacterized protein (TIGR00251 family)